MSVLIRYVYALQYEDFERAGVILDKGGVWTKAELLGRHCIHECYWD